jgi:predicted Zn-dependent protease
MRFSGLLLAWMAVGVLSIYSGHAQIEEESAEVFLEEYSDAFQEKFFEALKEKGIENYDRAVNLLLECKGMEPNYVVLDHELAQCYLADKKWDDALEFSLEAVVAEPENYWYANTLITILIKRNMDTDQVIGSIPISNEDLAHNLSKSLFRNKRYKDALELTKYLSQSDKHVQLKRKIEDSIKASGKKAAKTKTIKETEVVRTDDSLSSIKSQIETHMKSGKAQKVLEASESALEAYPNQPYFYYSHGWALQQLGNHKTAARSLETGLDYLFDDASLANKFYKTLAAAYQSLGNASKANMYLSKVKSGL